VDTARPVVQGAKQLQLNHWETVADGWDTWLEWMERNFRPFTDWFIDAAGWEPGVQALDVGCGAGYPALTAAARVAPGGTQVATDIVEDSAVRPFVTDGRIRLIVTSLCASGLKG